MSLTEFERTDEFVGRHIGPNADEQATMLQALGVASLDEMVEHAVPKQIRDRAPLSLGPPVTEAEALHRLRTLAGANERFTSLIGLGYSNTITPPVILR